MAPWDDRAGVDSMHTQTQQQPQQQTQQQRPPNLPLVPSTTAAASAAGVTLAATSLIPDSLHSIAAPAPRRAHLSSPSAGHFLKVVGSSPASLAVSAGPTPSPELERGFSPDLSAYFTSLHSAEPSPSLLGLGGVGGAPPLSVASTSSAPLSACSSATSSAGADSCGSGALSASATSSDGDSVFVIAGSDGTTYTGLCSSSVGAGDSLFEELNGPITQQDLSRSPVADASAEVPLLAEGAAEANEEQQGDDEASPCAQPPPPRKCSRTATTFTFRMSAPMEPSPSPEPSSSPPVPSAPGRSPDPSSSRPAGRPPYPLAQISVGEAAAAALALDGEIHPPWPPIGSNFSFSTGSSSRRLSRSGNQAAAEEMQQLHAHAHASQLQLHSHSQSRSQGGTPTLGCGGTFTPSGGSSSALSAGERRALYVSSNPLVRFVPSYAAAVSGCMNASQLAARNPALIGKLLRYFIAHFLRKYLGAVLTVLAAVAAVEWADARWAWGWSPLLLALLLLRTVWAVRSRVTVELRPGVPLRHFSFFKHPRLLARAKLLPVARLYGNSCFAAGAGTGAAGGGGAGSGANTPCTPGSTGSSGGSGGSGGGSSNPPSFLLADGVLSLSARQSAAHVAALSADIYSQPSEGYCGHATLNNLLGSIAPPLFPQLRGKFFVALPELVRPFELREMAEFIREVISASGVLAEAVEKVECLYGWDDAPPAAAADLDAAAAAASPSDEGEVRGSGYSAFMGMVSTQFNDPRYRFMANFLRTPLFFCQEDARMVQHLRSGSGAQGANGGGGSGSWASPLPMLASPQPASQPQPQVQHSSPASSSISAPPVSLGRKLFSGHWSPLLGWLDPAEVERMLSQRGGSATPQLQQPQQQQPNSSYAYPASPAGGKLPLAVGSVCRSSPLRNVMTRGIGLSERMEHVRATSGGNGGAAGGGVYVPGSPINERGSRDSSATTPEDEDASSGSGSRSGGGHATTASASASSSAGSSPPRATPPLAARESASESPAATAAAESLAPFSSSSSSSSSPPIGAASESGTISNSSSSGGGGSGGAGLRARTHYVHGTHGHSGSFGSFPPPSALARSSSHSSSSDGTGAAAHTLAHGHSHNHLGLAFPPGPGGDRVVSPWGGVSGSTGTHSPSPFLTPTPRTMAAGGGGGGALHPLERASLAEGLCLIADVNPAYAHFLLPPRRLFEAVNTTNLLDGTPRGIIRITLKTSANQ